MFPSPYDDQHTRLLEQKRPRFSSAYLSRQVDRACIMIIEWNESTGTEIDCLDSQRLG